GRGARAVGRRRLSTTPRRRPRVPGPPKEAKSEGWGRRRPGASPPFCTRTAPSVRSVRGTQNGGFCRVAYLLRMHSEVRRPETIAIGRKRNERGLRDRSAGFERARKLISFATSQLLWLPVGSRPSVRAAVASDASVPSLRHERAAPCVGTPAAASSTMRLPEIGQFADSHSAYKE